ncbi:uncharacterized protein LOC108461993 [Gossypium arboreum]|uniref:uncharacterized protein LOC108461993 n=1 Tax=Gossypium arboreum TaxID=29729 RepID=UPI0022F1C0B0|nr:uncharacterized protein LOC108461993 [Gossypium arboreum]
MGSKIPTGSNQNGKIHLAAESTAINFDNSNNVVPSMEVVLENWEKEVQVLRGSGSKGMSIKSERNLNRTIKGHGGHFKVAGYPEGTKNPKVVEIKKRTNQELTEEKPK